jgi:hypothetical protein
MGIIRIYLLFLLSFLIGGNCVAQFDDLYSVPVKRIITVKYIHQHPTENISRFDQSTRLVKEVEIIDESLEDVIIEEYYDDYIPEYTYRIQRFHQPYAYVYNPYIWPSTIAYANYWTPGSPVMSVNYNWYGRNRSWSWNAWGWNSWNHAWGWNSWNHAWGWNSWNHGWGWNNNIVINNHYNRHNLGSNWNNTNNSNTVYGSRRVTSTTAGQRGRPDPPGLVGTNPKQAETELNSSNQLSSLRTSNSEKFLNNNNTAERMRSINTNSTSREYSSRNNSTTSSDRNNRPSTSSNNTHTFRNNNSATPRSTSPSNNANNSSRRMSGGTARRGG